MRPVLSTATLRTVLLLGSGWSVQYWPSNTSSPSALATYAMPILRVATGQFWLAASYSGLVYCCTKGEPMRWISCARTMVTRRRQTTVSMVVFIDKHNDFEGDKKKPRE